MILPDRLSAWWFCWLFRLMAINLTISHGFCCFFRLMAINLTISWGFFWLAVYLTITIRCNNANESLALFNHLSSSQWIQANAVVSQGLLERNLSSFMGTGDNVRSNIHIIHRSVMKAETWKYKYADSFVTHKMKLCQMLIKWCYAKCLCNYIHICTKTSLLFHRNQRQSL